MVTRGEHMEALKKTLKTYGKEGKRKYQQIKINKSDNLQDGTVYVLTESQYKATTIHQKELTECKESLANASEKNEQLKAQLETLTQSHNSKTQQLQDKIQKLEEEKTRYKILSETHQDQVLKLEEKTTTLTEKLEKTLNDNGRVTAQLEDKETQLEAITETINKKEDTIKQLQIKLHEEEKAKLSEFYMIHSRLTSLSLLDMLRGKHKPIIKEIAPTGELKEIKTITNTQDDID